jgi:HAD superfamily hydrolase (TIGR01509 family)
MFGPNSQIAVFFEVVAAGELTTTNEAYDHRWCTPAEVEDLLENEHVMPLDRAALKRWCTEVVLGTNAKTRRIRNGAPALLIDAGGVLVARQDAALFSTLDSAFGMADGTAHDVLETCHLRHALHAGRISPREVWHGLSARGTRGSPYSAFRDAWLSQFRVIDENIRVLEQIRQGFPELQVVLATNIDPITEAALARSYSWPLLIDGWVSSFRVGACKPEREFFEEALQLCGITAGDALLVDDRERNLEGARALGMATFMTATNLPIDKGALREAVRQWRMSA